MMQTTVTGSFCLSAMPFFLTPSPTMEQVEERLDTVSSFHWQPHRKCPYHNTVLIMLGTSGAVFLLLHMFPIILTSFFPKNLCAKSLIPERQNLNIDNGTPTFSRVFFTCLSVVKGFSLLMNDSAIVYLICLSQSLRSFSVAELFSAFFLFQKVFF